MPSEAGLAARYNGALDLPVLGVMNILNDVIAEYPGAVSFASGRPSEDFFALDHWLAQSARFVRHRAAATGVDQETVRRQLCQYGPTNGIINDLVARLLANDEQVSVTPQQVMITSGCQEAMSICLDGLMREGDVLAVTTPTYIGITGLCAIRGIAVAAIGMDGEGPQLAALQQAVDQARQAGKRVRALYVIADFDNPTGIAFSLARRQALLAFCLRESILIIEDNPYGMLRYDGARLPTLFALDQHAQVIHLGTFSKTLCPGFRVGFLASKVLLASGAAEAPLVQLLSQVKSLTTVNTGQYIQSVVGGVLLSHDCSLAAPMAAALAQYRSRRDAMLAQMERYLGAPDMAALGLSWNRPEGGFFITLRSSVSFGMHEMRDCAARFGVICIPMRFFAVEAGTHEQEIRLAFSYVDEQDIDTGIAALARYLASRHAVPGVLTQGNSNATH